MLILESLKFNFFSVLHSATTFDRSRFEIDFFFLNRFICKHHIAYNYRYTSTSSDEIHEIRCLKKKRIIR